MAEFRANKKRPRRKLLQEALENVTTDNVELHKIVIILENEQRESERIERQLVQEVEDLREHIVNLKSERQQEEIRLKEVIRQLKAELYDLGMENGAANNAGRNQPQNNSFWSRMSILANPLNCCLNRPLTLPCIRNEREQDILEISDPGVVLYDRRSYPITAEGGPTLQNGVAGPIVQSGPGYPVTRGSPNDIYTTRDFPRQPQRTKGEFEDNHRISAPVPPPQEYNTRGAPRNFNHQRILTRHEEVEALEAAARAFLSVFVNLRANIKRELWNSMLEMHDEVALNINHLPGLLHRLVVYAYNEDNPHQSPPSPVRTKPLVSLLKFRLAPYLKGRQYISFEHFKMFPIWMQPREALQMPMPPSNLSNQNQPVRGDDARRQLQVGSACFIWSEGGRRWCEGEVIDSKFDKEGEWLVVRYCSNEKWSEKEVQRYSDLVWGITPS